LNVHGVADVRHAEIRIAVPLVPEPSAFEVEISIEKLTRHKSPGNDQFPAELIKVGGRTVHTQIYRHINSIWSKQNYLRSGRT
jgi:hypothetical protein